MALENITRFIEAAHLTVAVGVESAIITGTCTKRIMEPYVLRVEAVKTPYGCEAE